MYRTLAIPSAHEQIALIERRSATSDEMQSAMCDVQCVLSTAIVTYVTVALLLLESTRPAPYAPRSAEALLSCTFLIVDMNVTNAVYLNVCISISCTSYFFVLSSLARQFGCIKP